MVSRVLAANALVNDPTHQICGGVLIPVWDEEELLNADPKLLEMLAEINCLNTNFTLSLAGDRHPEIEGNAREDPPKRPRGTPESQDSPPEAPSPKRLNDGVGGMEADAPTGPTVEVEQAVSSTAQVPVPPLRLGSPPGRSLGALDRAGAIGSSGLLYSRTSTSARTSRCSRRSNDFDVFVPLARN